MDADNATPSDGTPSDTGMMSGGESVYNVSDGTPSDGTPSDHSSNVGERDNSPSGQTRTSVGGQVAKQKRRSSQEILADPTTPPFIRRWADEFQSWSNDQVNRKIWDLLQNCRQRKGCFGKRPL